MKASHYRKYGISKEAHQLLLDTANHVYRPNRNADEQKGIVREILNKLLSDTIELKCYKERELKSAMGIADLAKFNAHFET